MKDGKHVILCIDDDPDYLESIRMILESNGYAVAQARSAEEGLRVFRASKPDLIVIDLMMEEVDSGMNLVKELQLAGNRAPLYMLSSAGDQLFLNRSYAELGLDGLFQKPIQPQVLLSTLKQRLG
jgi:DNA-binding response OmpR family regulator